VHDNYDEAIVDNPFTQEQEEHFQRRYREGFDLYIDPDYNQWLKANHPESGLLGDYAGARSSSMTRDTAHTSDQEQGNQKICYLTIINTCKHMLIDTNGASQKITSFINAADATQPEQANLSKKFLPKAQLLTNETCLAKLWEKEEDERKAAEEKERKRHEREEKRKARLQMLEEKKEEAQR